MPIYPYFCEPCGHREDIITPVNFYASCPKCGKPMKREFHARYGINMGAAGAYGYYDENLGCHISTNRQRREEMKRQGVSEKIGKGWR